MLTSAGFGALSGRCQKPPTQSTCRSAGDGSRYVDRLAVLYKPL